MTGDHPPNASSLRELARRARRLAADVSDRLTKERLQSAAQEYDQRAHEVEMDEATGQ